MASTNDAIPIELEMEMVDGLEICEEEETTASMGNDSRTSSPQLMRQTSIKMKNSSAGGGGGYHAVDVGISNVGAVSLTWDDLFVTVRGEKSGSSRTILEGSTGYAQPGCILAIMGPSGCGKSTLLDALAGRLASNAQLSGRILVNGRNQELAFGTSAYVTQDDRLMTTLTVREAVYYSAQLQLPDTMTKSEKWDRAETVIKEMGLQNSMDTRIGNGGSTGLSGGQKRRVSICQEMLMRPWLLFMDEPTSGLDSAASFHVMSRIALQARQSGRTIVVSIHQPSTDVFGLFDDLCLLAYGKTIYFGKVGSVSQFFSESGYACPTLRNPADHYLKTINKDFDQGTEEASADEAIRILVMSYRTSDYRQKVIKQVAKMNKEGNKLKKESRSRFLNQCVVLTKRSGVNMFRDIGYYRVRLVIFFIIALTLDALFFQLGDTFTSIADRVAMMLFVSLFLTFMSISGFPSFVEDIKIFERERLNGHYGVVAYVIGHTFSSMPFLAVVTVIPALTSYFLVGLHAGIIHFVYFTLNLYACMLTMETLMMMVASIVPNFILGIITGAGIQGLLMLTGGFFRLPDELPLPVWKYPLYYIASAKYTFQGFSKNEFIGLIFYNKKGRFPRMITGELVLSYILQMEVGYSKWVDLGIVFGMVVVYKLLFIFLLKIKEKLHR